MSHKHLRPKCHICHKKLFKNPGNRMLDKFPSWDCKEHGTIKEWRYVSKRFVF